MGTERRLRVGREVKQASVGVPARPCEAFKRRESRKILLKTDSNVSPIRCSWRNNRAVPDQNNDPVRFYCLFLFAVDFSSQSMKIYAQISHN